MSKYLLVGSYSPEGLRGLQKDSATKRREAVAELVKSAGGTLEAFYYAFGGDDVITIVDAPDNVSISAISIAASASGMVRTRVTPLLTVQEVDTALKSSLNYRPPGR